MIRAPAPRPPRPAWHRARPPEGEPLVTEASEPVRGRELPAERRSHWAHGSSCRSAVPRQPPRPRPGLPCRTGCATPAGSDTRRTACRAGTGRDRPPRHRRRRAPAPRRRGAGRPAPTMMTWASIAQPCSLAHRARHALEEPHVAPVRPRQPHHRREASQERQQAGAGVGGEHESWVLAAKHARRARSGPGRGRRESRTSEPAGNRRTRQCLRSSAMRCSVVPG